MYLSKQGAFRLDQMFLPLFPPKQPSIPLAYMYMFDFLNIKLTVSYKEGELYFFKELHLFDT